MKAVQNTPYLTIEHEGNKFFFKLEYRNRYGACHYSRVFMYLMYIKEMLGIIKPGDTLLETTSGSGGRAAAAVAKALGYAIHIGIPLGGEKAREQAILDEGAILHYTPAEEYVSGFPKFVKNFLIENPEIKYLNHCMGDINGSGKSINHAAVFPIYTIVEEVAQEVGCAIDYVVTPMGNGTTTLPFVEGFKELNPNTKVVGVESFTSAFAYRKKYPGVYEENYAVNPIDFPRHNLPGTTPNKATFPMPALEAAILLLDDIKLVSDSVGAEAYKVLSFKDLPQDVVRWDLLKPLDIAEFKEFGRSALAAFAVAQSLGKNEKGKTFFVPVLDASYHYDS